MHVFDADHRLRVAVFFSGGASGFRYLAANDPNFGDSYAVVVGFTDDPSCRGVSAFNAADVPVESNDLRAFYDERDADRRNLDVRAAFDKHTRSLLEPYEPDLVLLSGYMWILTEPIIDTYPTVNVHPADLTIEDETGERVYVGFDPVADAIHAGEPETRSCVHFVTSDVDAGPILVRSKPFPVHQALTSCLARHEADEQLRGYIDAHQEWMKWEGDGPCLAAALDVIGRGHVKRDGGTVVINGEPGYLELGVDE